jgi:ech hydrogenase subunit E
MTIDQPKKFIVPIGPQHPALKEPGNFEFSVDGEIITGASIRLGYVHRGIEKGTEVRNWVQNLYLLERICGICSHTHATAYALGVERLAEVTVPPRAQAIRTLVCEMERIHSHFLWLGLAAHQGGFNTLFMYAWRDREKIMDLLEELTGNRVHYSLNVLGGVKVDINPQLADAIRRGIDFLEERTRYYLKVVSNDETFLGRTRDIGYMSAELAQRLGIVGPAARASGAVRDVRSDAPYAGYQNFKVNVISDQKGDLEARFAVRIKELMESYRLIRLILDAMPSGELTVRVPRRIPAGEVISRVEAPRGELFYFIRSKGEDRPDRIKVRTPSLCNWGAVIATVVGHNLADVPMILAGIDPCFSCNDRMVRIRRQSQTQDWSWEDLRQYGIEYYR